MGESKLAVLVGEDMKPLGLVGDESAQTVVDWKTSMPHFIKDCGEDYDVRHRCVLEKIDLHCINEESQSWMRT